MPVGMLVLMQRMGTEPFLYIFLLFSKMQTQPYTLNVKGLKLPVPKLVDMMDLSVCVFQVSRLDSP